MRIVLEKNMSINYNYIDFMTQYSEFMKQYAQENSLSYKQAMKEGKGAYQNWKKKDDMTLDLSFDTEVEPEPEQEPMPKKKRVILSLNVVFNNFILSDKPMSPFFT